MGNSHPGQPSKANGLDVGLHVSSLGPCVWANELRMHIFCVNSAKVARSCSVLEYMLCLRRGRLVLPSIAH